MPFTTWTWSPIFSAARSGCECCTSAGYGGRAVPFTTASHGTTLSLELFKESIVRARFAGFAVPYVAFDGRPVRVGAFGGAVDERAAFRRRVGIDIDSS